MKEKRKEGTKERRDKVERSAVGGRKRKERGGGGTGLIVSKKSHVHNKGNQKVYLFVTKKNCHTFPCSAWRQCLWCGEARMKKRNEEEKHD